MRRRRFSGWGVLTLCLLPVGCGGKLVDSAGDEGALPDTDVFSSGGGGGGDGSGAGGRGGGGGGSAAGGGGTSGAGSGATHAGGTGGLMGSGAAAGQDSGAGEGGAGSGSAGSRGSMGSGSSMGSGGTMGGSAGSGGTMGGGGAPAGDPLALLEEGMAFEFEAVPRAEGESSACAEECGPLTLRVEKVEADRLELLWGTVASARRLPATQTSQGWTLGEIPFAPSKAVLEPTTSIHMDEILLVPYLGEDGRVELKLTGRVVWFWADVGQGSIASQSLIGTQKKRAPVAYLPAGPHWVTTVLSVQSDKPLISDATARLTSSGGDVIDLAPRFEEGLVVEFSTSQVLEPGTPYLLEMAGEDFLGVGTPAGREVVTIPDFGTLSDGTFSTDATSGYLGGEIIDFRPIESAPLDQVLAVDPSERVLVRVPAQAGATRLVFDARLFTPCAPFGFDSIGMTFDAFVIGETRELIESYSLSVPSEFVELDLGGESVRGRAEPSLVEIPLGTSGSGDVLLEFAGYSYGKFGCDAKGVLLDNLRLE